WSDDGVVMTRRPTTLAAQARDHARQSLPNIARVALRQGSTDCVECPDRVLEICRALRLRPARELDAHRPRSPAHMDHLSVDTQADQDITVRAGTEPKLVAVPPAGKHLFGGRAGKRPPYVRVDGPSPAQPPRWHYHPLPAQAVRHHSPV